jgi:hypothetical protein
MADLVGERGSVDEEELALLEKSGVLASRKPKGKRRARSMSGPKHVVFLEEGEEGRHGLMCTDSTGVVLTGLLDTHKLFLDPAPAPAAVSNDDEELEVDLGWKPESHQQRKKGKQKAQAHDDSDLQLLEEESKVVAIPSNPF